VDVQIYVFFDLGTSYKRVVRITLQPLYQEERVPGTHWIGDWVGNRAGLDDMEK
jgi:hypothetical protein